MCRKEARFRKRTLSHPMGARRASSSENRLNEDGMRVFAGLVSDPFFMDVEAAIRTDISGKLSFNTAVQIQFIFATSCRSSSRSRLLRSFNASTAPRWSPPSQRTSSRAAANQSDSNASGGRKSRTFSWPTQLAIRARKGIELRDLYNREDAFALSQEYRPLYELRLDANLAFFDGLDGKTAWPLGPDGRHPLRDLLMDDFLIFDLAHPFAPGSLPRDRARADRQIDRTRRAGGRWLDDDILDELLTLMVNGGRGERFGDGVDAPTKPASLSFPYVREPNRRD